MAVGMTPGIMAGITDTAADIITVLTMGTTAA
jgi:hypothetical protein